MIWFSLKQIIPFYPLIQMIRVQLKHGILRPTRWHLILIWLVKLIVIEPFRIIEACVMVVLPDRKVRPIFILGFYRSGTTYLQELFICKIQFIPPSLCFNLYCRKFHFASVGYLSPYFPFSQAGLKFGILTTISL